MLLKFINPAGSLGYSNSNLLAVPFAHTALGAHSFSVASLKIWNSLPLALCSCNCPPLSTDTSKLITSNSSKPFHRPTYLPPCAADLTFADIVHIYRFHLITYLLTY